MTARKIVVASISVFGSGAKLMQVHLSSAFILVVIVVTCLARPFCDSNIQHNLLKLEILSLVTTWLTLWAGSVFNTYPRCEVGTRLLDYEGVRSTLDPVGTTLGWCDALSIVVGAVIIFTFLFTFGYFVALKLKCSTVCCYECWCKPAALPGDSLLGAVPSQQEKKRVLKDGAVKEVELLRIDTHIEAKTKNTKGKASASTLLRSLSHYVNSPKTNPMFGHQLPDKKRKDDVEAGEGLNTSHRKTKNTFSFRAKSANKDRPAVPLKEDEHVVRVRKK